MTARDDEQVPVKVVAAEIINGVEVPIGEPRERTISRGALDLLHGEDSVKCGCPAACPDCGGPIGSNDKAGCEACAAHVVECDADPLADRRQRAREAGQDHLTDHDAMPGIEAAIETATRVRVDADMTRAARDAVGLAIKTTELKRMIEAAFAAAGFEVEK